MCAEGGAQVGYSVVIVTGGISNLTGSLPKKSSGFEWASVISCNDLQLFRLQLLPWKSIAHLHCLLENDLHIEVELHWVITQCYYVFSQCIAHQSKVEADILPEMSTIFNIKYIYGVSLLNLQ